MRVDAWTPEEEEIIRSMAGKMTAAQINKLIPRRTYHALIMHASKLGVSLKAEIEGKYPEQLKKRARQLFSEGVPHKAISKELNVPMPTVYLWITKLKPKPITMSKEQAAIVIREAIREVAFTSRLKPSEIHLPSPRDAAAVAARNRAIRLAYRQGVDKDTLCSAFQRTRQLINSVIAPITCNH